MTERIPHSVHYSKKEMVYLHSKDHAALLRVEGVRPHVVLASESGGVHLREDEVVLRSGVHVVVLD